MTAASAHHLYMDIDQGWSSEMVTLTMPNCDSSSLLQKSCSLPIKCGLLRRFRTVLVTNWHPGMTARTPAMHARNTTYPKKLAANHRICSLFSSLVLGKSNALNDGFAQDRGKGNR
ncbi:hypothetical protein PISMIDRAFT_683282 [Pisolithus microcarpus 441]|uniref:Uncharacterized protein n=1 Tax=Pisolithus microcarpus 441 TaxID=765257 RepID=A0A0C9ZA04_9AGAM|nr:hypothetical protein PISMIDRAFT_683282 [Pisolithus microcarpus 441]